MAQTAEPKGVYDTIAGPFTWEDLEAAPDDGYRRELIHGVMIVSPTPIRRHQRALTRLLVILDAAKTEGLEVIVAPFDWRTAEEGTSLEPDLLVVGHDEGDPGGHLPGDVTPSLVIEVASPSTQRYDRTLKLATYERLGVPAYWIVDPADDVRITELRLDDQGRYETRAEAAGESEFATTWPFHLVLVPKRLAI